MSERMILAGFLTLSILGHLALLTLIALQKPGQLTASPKTLQVALIEQPQPEPLSQMVTETQTSPVPTEPVSDELPIEDQTEQQSSSENDGDMQDLTALSEISEAEDSTDTSGARLITNLNAQLPDVVANLNPTKPPENQAGHLGKNLPKLPGGPSLFDQWLGPVKPDLDRWRDASGGMNAQVTLANGDLVCIRLRAPTTQELFNPWMSAAVPMSRLCGRKKPESVDLENPWLRTRPR